MVLPIGELEARFVATDRAVPRRWSALLAHGGSTLAYSADTWALLVGGGTG